MYILSSYTLYYTHYYTQPINRYPCHIILGNFKETILIQLLSFICLFILLLQFFNEFYISGYKYEYTVPYIGKLVHVYSVYSIVCV